jgi:hypothetical protein
MKYFPRANLPFSKFSLTVRQSIISIPQDGSFSRGTLHDDRGELVRGVGLNGHRRDIHSLLANGVERELTQIILSDFSNIFRFDTPPTQSHHGCGHLASSLLGKSEHLHFRIRSRIFRNHTEEIHRVEAHPHHIKRFVLERKIKPHTFLLQSFYLLFKVLKKSVQRKKDELYSEEGIQAAELILLAYSI